MFDQTDRLHIEESLTERALSAKLPPSRTTKVPTRTFELPKAVFDTQDCILVIGELPTAPQYLYALYTMPREIEPSINERTFVLKALHENIRVDGRALDAFRSLDLSFGEEYGTAIVKLGKTQYDLLPTPINHN